VNKILNHVEKMLDIKKRILYDIAKVKRRVKMDAYIEIAEAIKKDVGKTLAKALSGLDERYIYKPESGGSFIRWGLVEKDIYDKIDYYLTCVDQKMG
jgi:hypothetical protein